jgi:endonuclease YncB( thermonuclease family)
VLLKPTHCPNGYLNFQPWPLLVMLALLAVTFLLMACTVNVPTSTPTLPPFTIEVGPFEPTLDISDCVTTICCSNCPAIPVDRIIDGDTFQSANATIRLYGVDAPERGEPCYDEATQRLRELAGDSVRVELGPRQGDQFGRILYYVYNLEGESIDEMLVREGLALAWLEDGQHRNVLLAVESRAKENRGGCLGGG